jgi:hypothetical protein
VLLLSTHALPIGFPCMPQDKVPCRNGAVWEDIPTSPVLSEYTKYMRGIDVADQLRASYSSLSQSHKWWQWVFLAMLDITEINMYIMHLSRFREGPHPTRRPLTHLQFKTVLCEALLEGWTQQSDLGNELLVDHPSIHMPSHTHLRRLCIVCKLRFPHTYCYK